MHTPISLLIYLTCRISSAMRYIKFYIVCIICKQRLFLIVIENNNIINTPCRTIQQHASIATNHFARNGRTSNPVNSPLGGDDFCINMSQCSVTEISYFPIFLPVKAKNIYHKIEYILRIQCKSCESIIVFYQQRTY